MAEENELPSSDNNDDSSTLELLNQSLADKDEVIEEKDEKDEKDEKEETEEKEVKLVTEEDKEEDDDLLKEVRLDAPFKKADIEKDFPGIFKKYPYLERAYYSERAYRETFATPEEAQEAKESIEAFGEMQEELLRGSSVELMKSLRDNDKRAFHKLADNYLANLHEVDPSAHNHVVSGVVKRLITVLAKEAKRSDNDEYRKAAILINRHIFDSEEFEPHKPLVESTNDDVQLEREQQFLKERYESSLDDMQTKTDNIILNTLKKEIDPKNSFSDYVRKNAIRDAKEDVERLLQSDKAFRNTMNKLWEKSAKENFSRESLRAIERAYLSKVQTVIAPAIKRARVEALKGSGKRVRDNSGDSDTTQTSERREYVRHERGSSASINRGQNNKADIRPGESTQDYLNRKLG